MFYYSKDGITVATIIDTRRPKNTDLYPVRIRVTYRRKIQYYPTGKDLTPEQWDALPKTKSSDLKDLRDSILNSFEIVRKEVKELAYIGGFSFDALNERLKAGVSSTVNTAFRAKINYLRRNSHIGNMSVYDNVLKGIERFKGKNITFESITVEWLRRYERFLLDENKTAATIGMHLRTIRAIINEAKRAGKIKETQYPFGRGAVEPALHGADAEGDHAASVDPPLGRSIEQFPYKYALFRLDEGPRHAQVDDAEPWEVVDRIRRVEARAVVVEDVGVEMHRPPHVGVHQREAVVCGARRDAAVVVRGLACGCAGVVRLRSDVGDIVRCSLAFRCGASRSRICACGYCCRGGAGTAQECTAIDFIHGVRH